MVASHHYLQDKVTFVKYLIWSIVQNKQPHNEVLLFSSHSLYSTCANKILIKILISHISLKRVKWTSDVIKRLKNRREWTEAHRSQQPSEPGAVLPLWGDSAMVLFLLLRRHQPLQDELQLCTTHSAV